MDRRGVFVSAALFLFVSSDGFSQKVWREETHQDFVDGVFEDSGANTYVSAAGRIQTINRWDANGDGFIDIVACNTHPLIEALDLSIYWGNGKDFDINRQSYVPVDGAHWVAAADLNADGRLDLVVPNYSNGTWTDMDSFVYYGGEGEQDESPDDHWFFPPFHRKITLPTQAAQGAAAGDLNRDGHIDLVFAFSGGHWEYRTDRDQEYSSPSRIFWGGEEGYDRESFTDLPAMGASDVAIGDLNGDGWLEIVFANASRDGDPDIDSFVYWGDPKGFSTENRTALPTHMASSVHLEDVDGDGEIDVIFTNEKGRASFAYTNESGSFSQSRKLEFETHGAKDSAVADFNKDGAPDVFISNHERSGNRVTESFLYYGSQDGFPEEDRVALPTIGAWGVSAADLNEDGWTDLFVSNYQEHYSYEVPSFIFWNSPDGFEPSRRTPIYEHGAVGNAIADFNGDEHLDILVVSFSARSRGGYDENYVYWGNKNGAYSVENRLELPGRDTYEYVLADLNDDAFVDLVFANSGEGSIKANENWIYWNKDQAFDPWRLSGLPSLLSLGVQTADLDRDGWLDLIVCNFGVDPRTKSAVSYVYWGSPEGFVVLDRTHVEHVARSCTIADLNEDGRLDLIFGAGAKRWAPDQEDAAVIFWGDGTRHFSPDRRVYLEDTNLTTQAEAADLDRDGHLDLVFGQASPSGNGMVLYGDGNGSFPNGRRLSFPLENGNNSSIADVNGDGWLDIVFPSYKSKGPPVSRSSISKIWIGGPDGFSEENQIALPTNSAAGSLVSDFNRDGFPDVFFYCHRQEGDPNRIGAFGDHLTDSFLYWGSPTGFDPENRLAVPTLGTHNDSGVDIGHIRNRGFEFGYVSSPYETGGDEPKLINWSAIEPHHSAVRFQLRSANSPAQLEEAVWQGPGGPGTYYTRRWSRVRLPQGNWIQYRAVLDTENGAYSPILSAVEVHFE